VTRRGGYPRQACPSCARDVAHTDVYVWRHLVDGKVCPGVAMPLGPLSLGRCGDRKPGSTRLMCTLPERHEGWHRHEERADGPWLIVSAWRNEQEPDAAEVQAE
jgi:hypothetical protein